MRDGDTSAADAPTLVDIYRARRRIVGHVVRTSLPPVPALGELFGTPIHVKPEFLQPSGAFKLRGAFNMALSLPEARRRAGFTTMSTGNHGRGVAYVARALGVPAVICMSNLVPAAKRQAVEAMGAEARIVGASQDEAGIEAARLVTEEGMILIPPFDHPDVIAGQGTIGLEILEDLPEVGQILVPLSGGGLLAGIALAAKAANPRIRIVGISMDRGAAMAESLRAGRPVEVTEVESLADSLGGGIGPGNRYTFELCRALMDEVVLLGEAEIASGMALAFRTLRVVLEGAGAIGLSALLSRPHLRAAGPTVVPLTGVGVDPVEAMKVIMAVPEDALAPRPTDNRGKQRV